VHVEQARWPDDRQRVDDLRARGVPRLLVVPADAEPPIPVDVVEDWVLETADGSEVRARLCGLERRAHLWGARPEVEPTGILRFRGRWVTVSPVECLLLGMLSDDFGAVVSRDALASHTWPDGVPTRNALDVQILRLRRRIAHLDLEITTVRGRGYLLHESNGSG
jgi:DNA-binding response OmpR family regulator